MKKIKKVT
jgi:hypothetical protein